MEYINLVDPASSHTLVSKIKPCMSKYKQFCTVKLRLAHYISCIQLDTLDGRIWATLALTVNGEVGFYSGKGALETSTTSMEGSSPILTQGRSDNK
ncbi:hypothetical protein PsorP6_014448 [Peronosclerospora sorghi]|uniref:Uncharacterized protein n=1 Tax=Peronosclerospora sorghi TaxID=230839 RepID=A0ACC0VTG6_9STRA|nr:hypothetical protein PsorP6_014448 [Peronosclerospora sorghi]